MKPCARPMSALLARPRSLVDTHEAFLGGHTLWVDAHKASCTTTQSHMHSQLRTNGRPSRINVGTHEVVVASHALYLGAHEVLWVSTCCKWWRTRQPSRLLGVHMRDMSIHAKSCTTTRNHQRIVYAHHVSPASPRNACGESRAFSAYPRTEVAVNVLRHGHA